MAAAKHTPGPWQWRVTAGAGLEIFGDVSATMGKDFANLVAIYGLDACQAPKFQIAYERWVQFPKREWDEMQRANAQLMATAPEQYALLIECRDAIQWCAEECGHKEAAALAGRIDALLAKATGSPA